MSKEDNSKFQGTKSIDEAVALIPEMKKPKFVSSVDLDIVLNLKEKQLKESVRGSVEMPNTFGADKKVVAICDPSRAAEATKAGAVAAGLDDVVEKLMNNAIEFDVVIATPDVMPKIVQLGKVLGPKGLMPNPKNGTISDDIAKTVGSFKGGKTNFKMEQGQGVIRGKVAQVDMKAEEIKANMLAFLRGVVNESRKLSPQPLKKVVMTTTMGASIKLDVNDIMSNI